MWPVRIQLSNGHVALNYLVSQSRNTGASRGNTNTHTNRRTYQIHDKNGLAQDPFSRNLLTLGVKPATFGSQTRFSSKRVVSMATVYLLLIVVLCPHFGGNLFIYLLLTWAVFRHPTKAPDDFPTYFVTDVVSYPTPVGICTPEN